MLDNPQSPRFPADVKLHRFQDLGFVLALSGVLGLIGLIVGVIVWIFNIPVVIK